MYAPALSSFLVKYYPCVMHTYPPPPPLLWPPTADFFHSTR